MRALVYGVPPEPFAVPGLDDGTANALTQNLSRTPTALRQLPLASARDTMWMTSEPAGGLAGGSDVG